jgi:hypothetical protein
MAKILFILKRREDYNSKLHSTIGVSTGLYNSASFMNNMLLDCGIESNISVVTDNNCIDKEVTLYKPSHVIIEALWVTPAKFAVLRQLHPTVSWIVRLHSEMPFMAGEGMAMDWLGDYSECANVIIACNAPRMLRETRMYLQHKNQWTDRTTEERVIYLPNYYPQEYKRKKFDKNKEFIDIGCFGAVRPLKNHLMQALGSIEFAENIGKKLRFHVNAGRIEMNGQPALNNLKGLFQHICDHGHQLINHAWTPREQFLDLCATMDIGMQVSFSETFNIVAADIISQGVPIVASNEIPWAVSAFTASPTDSIDIANKLKRTYNLAQINVWANQTALKSYTNKTAGIWRQLLDD